MEQSTTFQYDLFGGMPPHIRGSETSFEAAQNILPHVLTIASKVLDYIRDMSFYLHVRHPEFEAVFADDEPEILTNGANVD